MGDSVKVEDRLVEFLGEPCLEGKFGEDESDEKQFECTCTEKEKGKKVNVIDSEEMENLEVNHSLGPPKVVDNDDE